MRLKKGAPDTALIAASQILPHHQRTDIPSRLIIRVQRWEAKEIRIATRVARSARVASGTVYV